MDLSLFPHPVGVAGIAAAAAGVTLAKAQIVNAASIDDPVYLMTDLPRLISEQSLRMID
jgi:hypothetical protein